MQAHASDSVLTEDTAHTTFQLTQLNQQPSSSVKYITPQHLIRCSAAYQEERDLTNKTSVSQCSGISVQTALENFKGCVFCPLRVVFPIPYIPV